jgi:hypothetical protein
MQHVDKSAATTNPVTYWRKKQAHTLFTFAVKHPDSYTDGYLFVFVSLTGDGMTKVTSLYRSESGAADRTFLDVGTGEKGIITLSGRRKDIVEANDRTTIFFGILDAIAPYRASGIKLYGIEDSIGMIERSDNKLLTEAVKRTDSDLLKSFFSNFVAHIPWLEDDVTPSLDASCDPDSVVHAMVDRIEMNLAILVSFDDWKELGSVDAKGLNVAQRVDVEMAGKELRLVKVY